MFSTKFVTAAIVMSSVLQASSGLVFRRNGYGGSMSAPSSQGTQSSVTETATSMSTYSSQPVQSTETQTKVWSTSTHSSETSSSHPSSPIQSTETQTKVWSTATHFSQSTQSQPTQSSATHSGQPPKPTGQVVNCDNVLDWKPNTQYTAGDQTVFSSEWWTAKQWSYNNPPNDAAMEWTLIGSCIVPRPLVSVSCQGIPAWNKQAQYNRGSQVTYNGHLWYAPNWVSSNVPGDKSGSWVDEGACVN
ncbi:hypothetical protein BJ138DRAFT_618259 [Hygrophoropsis aurantiaca]|uniref:Uncharacterized protein n=1 Tax=Hygrophoropsis aurantiaca TaxID=72124 RepID=A0ACB8A0R6_9AGAM|nr:hypothetical protein BJ138DRAFT_618259 [Hygrophoropsis aurantiaca]